LSYGVGFQDPALEATGVMQSLQTRLESVCRHPTGFDYLRLILALSVVVWHSVLVCYGPADEIYFWTGPFRPLIYFILPAFFALSGFLVAGSLERNSISEFVTLRIVRIFPALAVEVLLSALIIGPLLTNVAWREYFSSPKFFIYFLNMIGIIHYQLPGVFETNPTPDYVNAQLWTIPFELYCYALLIAIALFGIAKRSSWLFALTLGAALVLTVLPQVGLSDPPHYGPLGALLILSFLFGVSLFIMRRDIAFSESLFLISIVAYWVFITNLNFIYLSAASIAYITVFLGLQNPRKTLFIRGADYSYGVYLYGFPLQQTICYLFPSFRIWYVNAATSVALALICAYLSWTFVESRILLKRKPIVSFVACWMKRFRGLFIQSLARVPASPQRAPSIVSQE
jgi:peptidoglycan/LPS O-acetylase OafA/YrhL